MIKFYTYIACSTYRQVRGERRQVGWALRNQRSRPSAKKPDNSFRELRNQTIRPRTKKPDNSTRAKNPDSSWVLLFIRFLIENLCSLYRRLSGRRTYLVARMKNDVSQREDEERRISSRGWRKTYLGARMKNDVYRRSYDQYTASIRRNMSLFIRAPRYLIFHFRGEIRRSSSARRYENISRTFDYKKDFFFQVIYCCY